MVQKVAEAPTGGMIHLSEKQKAPGAESTERVFRMLSVAGAVRSVASMPSGRSLLEEDLLGIHDVHPRGLEGILELWN